MYNREKMYIRELAKTVKELANSTENLIKKKDWYLHNDLSEASRPLIICDPENGWNEIFEPKEYFCETPIFRHYEFLLKRVIHSSTVLCDDIVVDDSIYVPNYHTNSGWGVDLKHVVSESGGGAYKTIAAIDDYDKLAMLKFPKVVSDTAMIETVTTQMQDVLGDILQIKHGGGWWWSLGLSNTAIDLRGLENFMIDMYDYPEELHKLMSFLCDANIDMLDDLERDGLLLQNNGNHYVGSGGLGFTSKLVNTANTVTTMDMWGFAESQETVSVSPAMFEEFVFPYQLKIAERFGLNCYGCCEPLDKRWNIVKQIPRLVRVSVSHWADSKIMAENLGDKYVYSLKPSPSHLATYQMNEEAARSELRTKIEHAKQNNCHLEIIMKDNHTLGKNPHNATRWVQIAREEINRLYK